MAVPAAVLAINGGSSSIKFAVYQTGLLLKPSLSGKLDRVGSGRATLSWQATENGQTEGQTEALDSEPGPAFLIDWLQARPEFAAVRAVGHRVAHGLAHTVPERVMLDLLDELRRATPYAPEHLPLEIELIEGFHERHPHLPQVACFDTAFHAAMPRVAKLLPIPRRYQAKAVRRYGFHGLSYAYLMEELGRAA